MQNPTSTPVEGPAVTPSQVALIEECFERIVCDLAMIADRTLVISKIDVERSRRRPAGQGCVHISFRMALQGLDTVVRHGCLLVPLPDAIALASYLMMVNDDAVASRRELTDLDSGIKDAMLEVGNFVAKATAASLQALGYEDAEAKSEGCQGVRSDVRPALEYQEGTPILVGRIVAQLHEFPEFEAILILPDLEPE